MVEILYETNIEGIESLIKENEEWRSKCVNLIASENVTSRRVRNAMASDFMHRYAEGHPGERYYRGTEFIDKIETDLKKNLQTLFRCDNVDVRPISGTNANEAVFSIYIKPGNIVMVNSTPGGGHISHHKHGSVGKFTKNIIDFPLSKDGYHMDVEGVKDLVHKVKPKLLIFGKSLFLFPEPLEGLRDVCEQYKVKVVYDAAHVLGLIAGECFQDPLSEGADIVTGSVHKTFFGTQRGIILSNVDDNEWTKIDKGAFPGSSSNHHLDSLVGLAMACDEMLDFGREYARQIVSNAKILGTALDKHGFKVQAKEFGYTESHQVAVDVGEHGGGKMVSEVLEKNDIILNMNLLPSESIKYVRNPNGVRIGVQEMTRFGMKEEEMERIAELMKECIVDKKYVKKEVNLFRESFQRIGFSYDK